MKILKILGGIVALIAVVFLLAGVFVPEVNYTVETEVGLPLEKSFSLYNDMERISEWIPEVKSVRPITETAEKTGSEYEMTIENDGNTMNLREKVLSFKENEQVSIQFEAGNMHKTDVISFEPRHSNTLITLQSTCRGTDYIHRCIFAFFGSMFKKIDQGYLDNFKAWAEKE